jgi:hypothetical protein
MDIQHQNVFKQLQYFLSIRKIPNIIFHGSSGSGKRTIVHEFIQKIYECDRAKIKSNVMYVNCAHGKGIRFIRDELKYFAKACMQYGNGDVFKSIVLMNADELTIDAQSALRRCIELFSHNTRFFIIVENKYKLLNPILSRFCEIFIPNPVIENTTFISLHQNNCIKPPAQLGAHFNVLVPLLENNSESKDHRWFLEYSNTLYENGCSCLDFLNFMEEVLGNTHSTVITSKFVYNKIKSEYRNEKMAMFYMFDFVFLRKNKEIDNLAFM